MNRPKKELTQDQKKLREYLRLRWFVRFGLAIAIAASVGANVLHAQDNAISKIISAWPPVALLFCVEYVTRIPAVIRWRAWVRLTVTAGVGGIAGWVSYWHMASVTANHGEAGGSQYLIPLTVDGLIIVASISLVELTVAIRKLEDKLSPETPAPAHVIEHVEAIASQLSVAQRETPEEPERREVTLDRTRQQARVAEANRINRSGPLPIGPSNPSPLTGRPLMDAPPQV